MSGGVPCGLCELPCVGAPLLREYAGKELPFCCMGCANVYAILLESGVIASGQSLRDTEIFKRSLELGLVSRPEEQSKQTPQIDPNTPTVEVLLQIGGMWCSACSWLVERALTELPGVLSAEVYFASDLAKVKYCPLYLPPENISARVDKLGYRASVYTGETNQAKAEIRNLLLRLGVAAFLWANIMGFSTILYVGYFEQIASSASLYLPYLLLTLATPMVFYSAQPILRAAWMGLRNGQIRMETLLSIGILTAYIFSAVQTFRGHTHLYFDTAAAIVTLVLTGKLIERVAKERAARSLALLYRFMPKKACLIGAGGERYVSIDALEPGAVFVVKAGERFPADGVLTEGETYADESLLTGESKPVHKLVGSALASGSLNLGGVVHVRASRTSSESALALIIRQVERALSTRAGVERLVDQVSRVFVPIVILLAVVLACVMVAMHMGVEAALMRATTILVIACPCALGLATPLAITAAVGTASQSGLLISDSSVLETMGRINTMVVDKTGTLTVGDFTLTEFALLSGEEEQVGQYPANAGPLREQLCAELACLAALENYSEHLLGRAIRSAARELDLQLPLAEKPEVIKGEGMRGIVDGVSIFIGNSRMAERCGASIPDSLQAKVSEWQIAGMTTAYFGRDGQARGALAFGDRLKDGAAEMVRQLRARGIRVSIVSGDAEATVRHAAALVGIEEYRAEATPEQKARIVAELQAQGRRVAMLGDGVNDAPALAQAELGIALGTGAEIAMCAAPVVLMSGTLSKVETAFQLAKKTRRIVQQNLFWAFLYNVIGITLAISGILNPIMAAAAMLLSSTSVVANSMRLSSASMQPREAARSKSEAVEERCS